MTVMIVKQIICLVTEESLMTAKTTMRIYGMVVYCLHFLPKYFISFSLFLRVATIDRLKHNIFLPFFKLFLSLRNFGIFPHIIVSYKLIS